jgi:asparagine synthase (glutamine-hydrolysing)
MSLNHPYQAQWHLVYGEGNTTMGAAWQDSQIAIVCPPSAILPIAFSPSQRFVVVGSVWLSHPSSESLSHLQFVANTWDNLGIETFNQLVGIFGLAIWDRQEQKLWLGRDRTGGYTIYFTTEGTTHTIAANLRSLNPYHSRELDIVALRDYLCCSFVPGERTLWQGVRELRPGSIISFPDQKIQTYWQLEENVTTDDSLECYGEQLRRLLEQIIQEYLPKNQPVGVFLSGGLDSSLVTALVTKFHSQAVHTYSIHFGETCPNELEFSSLVANHCQTEHHILEIPFRQMWQKLPETMGYLDDPIGDPLTVPNLLLANLAKKSVEVVLNGEGGDPCFGGPKNQPMLLNELYGVVSGQDPLQAYLLSFQKCAPDLPQLLKPDIWAMVQDQPYPFYGDLNSSISYLNRLMALNIKFKGADQILTKVNNLTQAAGIAGRSPLFDQRVVQLSMEIPPQYKLSGVQEKAVLKQAVADLLPEKILFRPKSGMMVPVQLGFQKYWQREAKTLLLNPKAAIAPYLNQGLIKEWLNYRGDTWGRYGVKLWLVVSLEIWLQVNGRF